MGGPNPVFNTRFASPAPLAVVRCATASDVREAIGFVRRQGLPLVARSGGHCFAGHSTIARGVVVDVTPLASVSVDLAGGVAGGLVTVGAGARLGAVYSALDDHGLAIPAGTCPTVGIAGLTLGGGLGILGRRYGLTSDRLLAAEIVLADGRILTCDGSQHPDLFWALRGAGAGNFGVVTSLTFRTVPAPPATTTFHLSWPFARAAAAIEAWQAWAPAGPDQLYASLKITAEGDRAPSVDVYGTFLGDAGDLVPGLVDRVGAGPRWSWSAELSFPETRAFWAQLPTVDGASFGSDDDSSDDDGGEPADQLHFLSRSEFFRHPLPADAIATLLDRFAEPPAPGEARELDFMPWGGAFGRVAPDATAFVHRDELFQLKHTSALRPDAADVDKEAAHHHVTASWAAVHPWGSNRVFPNFADPDLGDDAPAAYHGTNLDRLRQVKARYDPDHLFHFPQSIPPS